MSYIEPRYKRKDMWERKISLWKYKEKIFDTRYKGERNDKI